MKKSVNACIAAFLGELITLQRSPLVVLLTVIEAITFIFLVNFFGMTGAFAPTALIDNDKGYYAKAFIQHLNNAHHAFALKYMDEATALENVKQGKLVAVITIPKGFSDAIDNSKTIPLKVVVDNIDTDMTSDIKRALPSAITSFAKEFQLPNIHVEAKETDLINHDTDFIPYLVVSALALSILLISAGLGAVTIAREFESKTIEVIAVSPVTPFVSFVGKILATNVVSFVTMLLAVGIVIFGHGIRPVYPFELALVIISCIVIFGFLGSALGAVMKKTFPAMSLVFGLSLPLYLFSGTYEPERFDGNIIWMIAHASPLYYAVGILEHAALGLRVTPESIPLNFLALAGWFVLSLGILRLATRKIIL